MVKKGSSAELLQKRLYKDLSADTNYVIWLQK